LPEKAQGAGDWFCGSAIGPHGLILFSALALVAAGAAGAAEPVVYALAGTVITCEACGAGGDGGGSAALPHAGIGPFPVVSAQVGHTARFRWIRSGIPPDSAGLTKFQCPGETLRWTLPWDQENAWNYLAPNAS
jgi:hypothetical protein